MVVLRGIVNAEAQNDFVDEQGLVERSAARAKVGAGLEYQLVDTDLEIIALQDRLLEAPVVIGLRARQLAQFGIDPVQDHVDARRRNAARGIENVCGQPPHVYSLLSSRGGKIALLR